MDDKRVVSCGDALYYKLNNGLRIVYKEDRNALVTMIGYAVRVGSRNESQREHGIAHCLEHMLFKGTKKRSNINIINRIESVGGELNAYTTKEETVIYAFVPKEYGFRTVNILTDIVTNSVFPKTELEKEKVVIIDEIDSYKDSPSEQIYDDFENMLFSKSNLGHYILGTEKSVNSITSDSLMKFFKKHYQPNNMVLFLHGNIDFSLVISQVEYLFSSSYPSFTHNVINCNHNTNAVARIRNKKTHQNHIILGRTAYSMYDDRKNTLSLLTNILGGNSMNSRLNMLLREQEGLVYSIDAMYTQYSDTGIFNISWGCAKENTRKTIDIINSELLYLSSNGITEDELNKAKIQQKGQLKLVADSRESMFLSMGKSVLYFDKVYTVEEMFSKIDSIKIEDINGVAREILNPQSMSRLIYR